MQEKVTFDAGSVPTEIIYNDAEASATSEGLCGEEDAVCGDAPEGKERLFTQRELDDLICERLKRERRNNRVLNDAKGLIDKLREKGIITAISYADAARELESLIGSRLGENTTDVAEQRQEEARGELETAPSHQESVLESPSLTEAQFATAPTKDRVKNELFELFERYPEAMGDKILESRAFRELVREGDVKICDAYEAFKRLADSFSKNSAGASLSDREARTAISSTGFSRSSAGEFADEGLGLSPSQRRLARDSGISYREYASLLRDVPSADYLKRKER